MNSQSVQTVIDPVFQSKMPLFDGNIAATVLSKARIMPGFLDKQTLQYSGAYFAYDPRRKEGPGFTAPWSKPKASLLDGRSPVSHLSGMEGHNHLFYRQETSSSEEEHSSSALCHAPEKQGFTIYTKSPGVSNTVAATSVAVGKQKTRGENPSPPSDKSVYLAVPKPVYGHNPCCNELGCVMGQRYGAEHSSPRITGAAWMQSDAHYSESPPAQRKAQGTLLQQRGLQFGSSAEPVKMISVESCSPRSTRTLPAMLDPNFSSYPCTPARTMFGSLSEQSQRLQTPPRGYPSLHPSHPTYEHMTSEVYQERSPMSKYGHLTQYPVFYYPQANEEDQNSTQCKNMHSKQRDVPVILKSSISSPQEHYIVPQSLHGEIPLPSTETLPNHSFMQRFDYPCYAVPRFNASPIRAPIKGLHAPPSCHGYSINISPSSQHRDHPLTSASSPHRDKPSTRANVDQSKLSLPYMCRDPTSPARFTNQPGVSPPGIKTNRFLPTIPGLLMDQHIPPPGALNRNRRMDCSSCEPQVTWPKQPIGLPVSPVAWLPHSPGQSSEHTHAEVTNSANVRKILYSPAALQENKYDPTSSSSSSVLKGCLKRSISHPSPLIKVKEEVLDVCEVEIRNKRRRVEVEYVGSKTNSPPMPVIDSVFSLAPYHTYLQVSGGVCPSRAPQRTAQASDCPEVKTRPDTKVKIPDRDKEQLVVSLNTKEICPGMPTVEPVAEIVESKTIKVEKQDPSDTDYTVESPASQQHCSKRTIKQEPEGTNCDSGHILVIKKFEADECESKTSLTDESVTSDEPKSVELTAQTNSSAKDDKSKLREHVASLHSKPMTPSQPPESKPSFTNIPPRCLRKSTYKLILPDTNQPCRPPQAEQPSRPPQAEQPSRPPLAEQPSRPPLAEKPPAQPETVCPPKPEIQKPVRKHFLELHNALCKLVSQSVSASSEEDLRTWLSQLQLTEPSPLSTKVQKVSCLLGVKAREVWLKEEMKTALHEVLARLREYTIHERCPFPHVMRTGAVFLPMLVIKEMLFPTVQGSFVDQVLHKHKVELRPTTLSEEKILIQLHKRACSSRLRRLMSLKHLPDIYADVVNLLYYANVCKRLGVDMDEPAYGVKDDGSEETPVFSDTSASPVSQPESHPQRHLKDQEAESCSNRIRTSSRVKSSSRRMFLDNSLSDEEAGDKTGKTVNGGILEEFPKKHLTNPPEEGKNRGSDSMVTGSDSSLDPQSPKPENSWTCPLTLDELSPSPTDSEPEESSTLQTSGHSASPVTSKHRSGMILKLRKMFSEGLNRKRRASYKAVSESGAFADSPPSETEAVEGGVDSERDGYRGTPSATRRWQRTGSFSPALRPLSSPSKRKHRSLSKIKYCPYLSACHSAEHRRRWVLRSAVQRACGAMRLYYPDLVGKKICHLYEEDDKSEVWYRGEVLRIHEAHTNPLKTIFEVRYDSEPEWKYYLELLIDYKKGWLKIED